MNNNHSNDKELGHWNYHAIYLELHLAVKQVQHSLAMIERAIRELRSEQSKMLSLERMSEENP